LGEVEKEIRRGDAKRLEEEIGDLLFAITSLSRYFQFDAELALQRMVGRWVRRFQRMERLLKAEGIPLNKSSINAMERIWGEIGEEGKDPRRTKKYKRIAPWPSRSAFL
jgi:uncharacterized protein YabN with tetrapyrrole methylase and pyrophosphatase domain